MNIRSSVIAVIFGVATLSAALPALAGGMGGGCGNCGNCPQGAAAPSDPAAKFQADTLSLRQELMNKRFDLQRENLKAVPDAARQEALRSDIRGLQAQIVEIRRQSGLPEGKLDGECAPRGGKGCGSCGQGGGCAAMGR